MRTGTRGAMRWAACAAGVGLALVPMTGRAEDAETLEEAEAVRRTVVLAMPTLGLVGLEGLLGFGVEHAVGSHVTLAGAVQLSARLTRSEVSLPGPGDSSSQMWGVGVEPGVHFYFAGRAPEGFWVGPHLELSTNHHALKSQYLLSRLVSSPSGEMEVQTELVHSQSSWRTVHYGGSLRLGYTAILSPGLTFQVGAGLSVITSRHTPFGTPVAGGLWGLQTNLFDTALGRNWTLAPRMTVALGWAF